MRIDLEAIFSAEKALPIEPSWKRRADDPWLRLVSPVDIEGVTIEGVQFGASCNLELPDQTVAFQLEYFPPSRSPRGGPICRIDWLPLSAHNNKGAGPEEFRHMLIRGSHHHPFEVNWAHAPAKLRKGILPIALPIVESLTSFTEALAFAGKEFRINNVSSVPVPPWERALL